MFVFFGLSLFLSVDLFPLRVSPLGFLADFSTPRFEREDLAACVELLRRSGRVSRVALWGRSMGAFTAPRSSHGRGRGGGSGVATVGVLGGEGGPRSHKKKKKKFMFVFAPLGFKGNLLFLDFCFF